MEYSDTAGEFNDSGTDRGAANFPTIYAFLADNSAFGDEDTDQLRLREPTNYRTR
jgi:hypothetical protein